jgi:hypothetical protein
VKEVVPQEIPLEKVDLWFQDETRVGQQGSQTRIWARKGTRPRIAKQQQFLSQYIFGAVCPSQKACAGLVFPTVNHHNLEKHLQEIACHIPEGRHAVVIMDQAGWHVKNQLVIPNNMSILYLPARSPELNPQENVWQYIKDQWLANRTFDNTQDILNACCQAWNLFATSKDLIASLTTRKWAQLS